MTPGEIGSSAIPDGIPVSPSLQPALERENVPVRLAVVDRRLVFICVLCIAVAGVAAIIAEALIHLISLITNLAFFARLSSEAVAPGPQRLGLWMILVPVVGGLIVGLMARYGSSAIRGHGIPEAMEQVLLNRSRIPARMTFLKPLSAAIAIGTGGPFGAEGPIIATGGALGSVIGQIFPTTAAERKTLLAAGAAAGMAATFGSPVSAVLLAIELLLFEFRPRSIIPVSMAAVTAAAIRMGLRGTEPMFAMPNLMQPSGEAMAVYVLLGAIIGIASVGVTRAVYAIEDAFEHLPIHWMWWPAVGAIAVGVVGYFFPRTLGVGYVNISDILGSKIAGQTLLILCVMKFVSWSISLGSGTSGGTLAPLFTIGGAMGAMLGAGAAAAIPSAGIDPRIAALVGMAAIFAGASRAMLASVVFAFETTLQPLGLLPLLGGCAASFLVSSLLMSNSIMTEKIVRRGTRVPSEYSADFLDQVLVGEACARNVVTLDSEQTIGQVRSWINSHTAGTSHQGFPVVDIQGSLIGVLTRRDLLDPSQTPEKHLRDLLHRPPRSVYDDCTCREAADHMVHHDIGRLPVISRKTPHKMVGIITRSDLLKAHRRRLDELHRIDRTIDLRRLATPRGPGIRHPQ